MREEIRVESKRKERKGKEKKRYIEIVVNGQGSVVDR